MKRRTLWVGASAGGHMTQLLTLLKFSKDWPFTPVLYITTNEILVNKLSKIGKTINIGECNRLSILSIMKVFLRSIVIIFNRKIKKPDIIITTGSLPIAVFCLVAKLRKTKIIWIDSIANVDEISMSGKLMRHVADLFFVQWRELSLKYPKTIYVGELL
ncbi:hypothetical protein DSCO28_18650 [Desulfosarcina ovata subsp. sediminis]|uniref:UDP-N-acetylglucosamine--LPS N-acetylglucosamine transferase n=1 Tax=Desulfosarcina ovata subsp. sediminis TaxID=885957 RepID=A0A5K7ZNP0_9BACT|nr:hypothetical protein [Desulfosarcina ovata]BBO81299.1 hypothetical protein DSCO28_18650 [Desulfosarcina ovata subsp. sediminis]